MAADTIDPTKILDEGHDLFFAEPPDYRGAAELFEKVVALKPDWVEGHGWLGSAYERLGDDDRAAKEHQIAHDLDPSDTRPLISLGVIRTRQRRLDEAIGLLEQGIALKPHYCFADAKLFLAEAFEGAGELEKARQQWREVLELEPMYPSYDEPIKEAHKKLRLHGGAE
jgi:tetratricopeptide (TPR) repeat protein